MRLQPTCLTPPTNALSLATRVAACRCLHAPWRAPFLSESLNVGIFIWESGRRQATEEARPKALTHEHWLQAKKREALQMSRDLKAQGIKEDEARQAVR